MEEEHVKTFMKKGRKGGRRDFSWEPSQTCLIKFRTDLSTKRAGESGRVDSRSCIAFHSLMQLWSELMQLS